MKESVKSCLLSAKLKRFAGKIIFVSGFLLSQFNFISSQTVVSTCTESEAYYANPNDCRSYYYCWNGEMYLQYCPEGYYFHLAGRTCELPEVADCGGYSGQGSTSRPGSNVTLCGKICAAPETAKRSPVKGILYALCKCQATSTQSPSLIPVTSAGRGSVFDMIFNFLTSILPKPASHQ